MNLLKYLFKRTANGKLSKLFSRKKKAIFGYLLLFAGMVILNILFLKGLVSLIVLDPEWVVIGGFGYFVLIVLQIINYFLWIIMLLGDGVSAKKFVFYMLPLGYLISFAMFLVRKLEAEGV